VSYYTCTQLNNCLGGCGNTAALAGKLNQLDGALCDHHRVSLHNKPSSVTLIERAGQMKAEGGIHGSKVLQMATSLAQQCAATSSPLQQDALTLTRAGSGIKFHKTASLHPTAEEHF